MKKQLECLNCKTIVAGQERYLEAHKCPNCNGPTIIQPYCKNDNHMSYKEAISIWRKKVIFNAETMVT